MFRFTRDGRYVESAARYADGSRAGAESLFGRRLHDLLFREASGLAPRRPPALDTGDLQAFDFSLDLPGGPRDFEARIAPSGADEVTAIVRDFTDQRAAEAELQTVAGADRRGGRRRAPAAGARPPRRRPAAPRLAVAGPAPAANAARGAGGADDEAVAAADEAAAQLEVAIRRAARARPRHPSGDPHRGRPRTGDHGARGALGGPGRRQRPPGSPVAARRRGHRLLRGLGGPGERRQVRRRRHARASARVPCDRTLRVEVADDGVGGADQRGAPASAASTTGSPRSAGG